MADLPRRPPNLGLLRIHLLLIDLHMNDLFIWAIRQPDRYMEIGIFKRRMGRAPEL